MSEMVRIVHPLTLDFVDERFVPLESCSHHLFLLFEASSFDIGVSQQERIGARNPLHDGIHRGCVSKVGFVLRNEPSGVESEDHLADVVDCGDSRSCIDEVFSNELKPLCLWTEDGDKPTSYR